MFIRGQVKKFMLASVDSLLPGHVLSIWSDQLSRFWQETTSPPPNGDLLDAENSEEGERAPRVGG